uniref:SAC domain-containing protein n=1 Tax=Ditylum brightwellii TaxID=49249 RepID=A0A7S1YPH1_9STRA
MCYDEVLLSRRSKYRTGTRFTKRGCDDYGHVANYAETEQICFITKEQKDSTTTAKERAIVEVYSHVQTRGSIPIRWSSPADVKTYRPLVRIGVDPIAHARGLRNHLLEQLALYTTTTNMDEEEEENGDKEEKKKKKGTTTKLVFCNLVDKHGDQGRLGRAFDAVLDAVLDVYTTKRKKNHGSAKESLVEENDAIDNSATNSNNDDDDPSSSSSSSSSSLPLFHLFKKMTKEEIQHIWFDFHAECSGGKWDRLSILLKSVSSALDSQGYFSAVPRYNNHDDDEKQDWNILSLQNGVIRTNCMDCLDRTNVVQSVFGRYVLYRQLHERIGKRQRDLQHQQKSSREKRTLPLEHVIAYRQNPLVLPWIQGEVSHRLLWADNADIISRLYAGTNALKGDFTRTGKRTKRGALDDGMNSLQRYYLNNFIDAERQEGMDLLVGYSDFTTTAATSIFNDDDDDDNGTYNGSGASSLLEATRALLLRGTGGGGSSGRQGRSRLVKNEDKQLRRLDLRWLPGDLKDHVRSSAFLSPSLLGGEEDDVIPNISDSKENSGGNIDDKRFFSSGKWIGDDDTFEGTNSVEKDGGILSSFTRSTTALALEAIDRRAASDRPWWVLEEEGGIDVKSKQERNINRSKVSFSPLSSLSMEEEEENDISSPTKVGGNILLPTGPTGGQVLGSLFAVARAPVATATVVLCLLAPGLSATMRGENDKG